MAVYHLNGQELHVVEKGPPVRQVALLIHGWSSSSYALSPLLELLSLRFRCLSVDLPGYGKSSSFPNRTTIPAYADLLAELIAEVSDGSVVLVGHSMGGMISMTLALRHPVRLRGHGTPAGFPSRPDDSVRADYTGRGPAFQRQAGGALTGTTAGH